MRSSCFCQHTGTCCTVPYWVQRACFRKRGHPGGSAPSDKLVCKITSTGEWCARFTTEASVCPTLCVLAREWVLSCVTLLDCTRTYNDMPSMNTACRKIDTIQEPMCFIVCRPTFKTERGHIFAWFYFSFLHSCGFLFLSYISPLVDIFSETEEPH